MPISDSQKVDYLWKKIGFGVAKTDTNAAKKAPNESIASSMPIRSDLVWTQAENIPSLKPSSNTSYVAVYSDSNGGTTVEATEDTTATQYRTWKTNLNNWVPPEFGSTYIVKVYVDDAGESAPETTGTQLFPTGSGNNDEWFYDYSAGLLHFIGDNLPNGVNFTGKSIYIVGARYIGPKGLSSATSAVVGNNASFTSLVLTNVLEPEYGGTGTNTYVQDGVFYARNSNTISFATGSSGDIMQIAANGSPSFGDLDGGNYS